jgi:glutathione synthase/RimK-type ligase-like ATP-grasp enzyme
MASLLIGYRDDPHLLAASKAASRRGVTCFTLDPHSLRDLVTVNLSCANAPIVGIVSGEDRLESTVNSVWFRFKPIVELPYWGPMQISAAQFAQGEWRTTLRALENFFPDALWINRPRAQNAANSKIEQLARARDCGFKIPDTRVTNDPDEVIKFIRGHGRVVYKTLEFAGFPDQTGVYTTEIDESMITANAASIRRAPGIFQGFVEKDFEIRATVVGEQIFAARINTPKTGKGTIDWRHNIFDNIYEPCELDIPTKDSILAFQRVFGIVYGAYDLIRTPAGEVYFLECNPAGQYMWLEEQASLPITEAIAGLLCEADQKK